MIYSKDHVINCFRDLMKTQYETIANHNNDIDNEVFFFEYKTNALHQEMEIGLVLIMEEL